MTLAEQFNRPAVFQELYLALDQEEPKLLARVKKPKTVSSETEEVFFAIPLSSWDVGFWNGERARLSLAAGCSGCIQLTPSFIFYPCLWLQGMARMVPGLFERKLKKYSKRVDDRINGIHQRLTPLRQRHVPHVPHLPHQPPCPEP